MTIPSSPSQILAGRQVNPNPYGYKERKKMSNKKQLKGTCAYCGAEIIKNMSIRHLANCAARKHVIAEAESVKRRSETFYYHIWGHVTYLLN